MEPKYPQWLYDKRPVNVRGYVRFAEPSERRIEDRIEVFKILLQKGRHPLWKIDEIINYFRTKYEGTTWSGLGKKARQQLFISYKGRCMWCDKKMTLSEFTVEHIKPRVEGGADDLSNLGVACAECNHRRENVLITNNGYYNDDLQTSVGQKTPQEGTGRVSDSGGNVSEDPIQLRGDSVPTGNEI